MIAFNKFYNHFNIVSTLLITISLILLIFKGLNFGIDFKGGTLIELRTTDNNISVTTLRKSFNEMSLGDVNVKKFVFIIPKYALYSSKPLNIWDFKNNPFWKKPPLLFVNLNVVILFSVPKPE